MNSNRQGLIRQARQRFPAQSLSDTDIRLLKRSWGLTEAEIIRHWSVYPCQVNWALRRGGCGCTAIEPFGDQLCARGAEKDEVLEKLRDCQ